MNDTSTASATGLLTKVFIPGIYEFLSMFFNQTSQLGQFVAAKRPRLSQCHRIQPILGVLFGTLDMNVTRLESLSTKEEKTIATNAQDFRHTSSVSGCRWVASEEGVIMAA